jgi:hypothetical protein
MNGRSFPFSIGRSDYYHQSELTVCTMPEEKEEDDMTPEERLAWLRERVRLHLVVDDGGN